MKYIASFEKVHKMLIVPKRSCFNNFDLCLCYSSKGGATFQFYLTIYIHENQITRLICVAILHHAYNYK